MSEWTEKPDSARKEACVQPRAPGAPPHWLRCDYFNADMKRCIRGDRHLGYHEPPK